MSSLIYLVVRCHGQKARLIPPSQLKSMVETENINTFIEALLKTDYHDMVREVSWNKINGFILERIFSRKLIDRWYFVIKVSVSSEVAPFLQAYYRRFEVQNIRRILRGKVAYSPKEKIDKNLIPIERYSSVNFNALINSEGVSNAVKLLADTIYSPSKEAIQLYKNSNNLLPLEACFEKTYAEELMKAVEALPEDKEEVKRLVKVSFDVRNCITVVGGLTQGLNPRLLESLIIPYSFKVSLNDIVKIIRGDNALYFASSLFNPYAKVVNSLLVGEEATAYLNGLRYLCKESDDVRRMKTYSFAFILHYLISCEFEQRDLTTIALGKEYNIPPSDIAAHLLTH